jgi:hypothetical protein
MEPIFDKNARLTQRLSLNDSTVSGAAAFVLEAAFGDDTPFTVSSDVRPGTRSFPSFSAAVGNRGREGLRWHPLQNLMRAREYAWTSRSRLHFDPRDARFGRRLTRSTNQSR